jgi:transcription antitermination factor NusA-like protein
MKQKNNKLARFKQWILSIVKPRFSQDLKQAKKVKNLFLIYFDGCYGIDSVENTSNTFAMGVCKLEYKNNTLTVHLRRPGLLIGKRGCIIDALAKHLECKINIVEVSLLK